MVSARTAPSGFVLAILMLSAFAGGIARAVRRGVHIRCACFGLVGFFTPGCGPCEALLPRFLGTAGPRCRPLGGDLAPEIDCACAGLWLGRGMSITMRVATPDSLGEIVEAVAAWQHTGGPVQLHPGDLGWNWSLGGPELARAVRVWIRDEQILAAGMVDDAAGLIRLGIAPGAADDDALAAQVLADLSDPESGAIRAVEARFGAAFRGLLRRNGWLADESWTPLSCDLGGQVEDCGLRIEVIDAHSIRDRVVEDRVAVQRAMFANSTFSLQRWRTMAAAPPYRQARCLVGYDPAGDAVATVTVWSAGEGRPGLLEPLGVHRDHRGHGYGRAITVAAAAALREMGSSSATVCTPSSNVRGVATYVSAGFHQHPAVTDFRRPS